MFPVGINLIFILFLSKNFAKVWTSPVTLKCFQGFLLQGWKVSSLLWPNRSFLSFVFPWNRRAAKCKCHQAVTSAPAPCGLHILSTSSRAEICTLRSLFNPSLGLLWPPAPAKVWFPLLPIPLLNSPRQVHHRTKLLNSSLLKTLPGGMFSHYNHTTDGLINALIPRQVSCLGDGAMQAKYKINISEGQLRGRVCKTWNFRWAPSRDF